MKSLETVTKFSKNFLKDFLQVCRNKKEIWSIGIYTGKSPLDLIPAKNNINPILTAKDVTDIKADFIADPFMIYEDGTWYMFFEVFDKLERKGIIGLATSSDGYHWEYQKIILDEPFHLSYPYVFRWKNEYYMVPESYEAKSVRLYKAVKFPLEWQLVKELIEEVIYVDSSIFYFQDYWWLFTSSITWDTLYLYYSKELTGSWNKHPKSPLIVQNKSIARPGGRVVIFNEKIFRYAQDDQRIYGEKVRAFEVTELTPTTYQEKEVRENPILKPSGSGWNKIGMHHLDPHPIDKKQWIACVDGFQYQSLWQWIRNI